MTTTKQRLDEKIKKCTESAHSSGFISDDYEAGANLLAPLLLEMVDALGFYKSTSWSDEPEGRANDLGKYADLAINKFEDFLNK